eukprot:1395281-Amorphochlora_amoeboformis.AAC.1
MGSVGCGESHVYSVSTTRRFVNGVDSYDFSVGCLSDSMSVWIDDADGEPLETEAVGDHHFSPPFLSPPLSLRLTHRSCNLPSHSPLSLSSFLP